MGPGIKLTRDDDNADDYLGSWTNSYAELYVCYLGT